MGVLGVEGRTPGYLVRDETQREKLKGRTGRRARSFEDRLWRGERIDLTQRCLRETEERVIKERELSNWELERAIF